MVEGGDLVVVGVGDDDRLRRVGAGIVSDQRGVHPPAGQPRQIVAAVVAQRGQHLLNLPGDADALARVGAGKGQRQLFGLPESGIRCLLGSGGSRHSQRLEDQRRRG